jgi:hypothetical protein
VANFFPEIERRPRIRPPLGIPGTVGRPNPKEEKFAAEAGNHDEPSEQIFSVEGSEYHLISSSATQFLNRLKRDQPFALTRLSHGDWECLYLLDHYKKNIAKCVSNLGFGEDHLLLLAARLCDEWHHEQAMFSEHFISELLSDLSDKPTSENFFHAVSFKGSPSADGRLLQWTTQLRDCDQPYLKFFSTFFSAQEILFDATMLKRWMISGELASLPSLARQRPVVLLAHEGFSSLDERWQLDWLLHLKMPPDHAYSVRYKLLDLCIEKIKEAKYIAEKKGTKQPLFLTQGSSLAYWFIRRLFKEFPDVFYVDIGQALHPWFYDSDNFDVHPWDRFFASVITEKCGLDAYYDNLGVDILALKNLFKDWNSYS